MTLVPCSKCGKLLPKWKLFGHLDRCRAVLAWESPLGSTYIVPREEKK